MSSSAVGIKLTLFSSPGDRRRRRGHFGPGREGSAGSAPYRRAAKRRKMRSPENTQLTTSRLVKHRQSTVF
jgi:hypothetical protein